MIKKILISSLLATQLNSTATAEQLLDEIVAVVEDGIILRSELDRSVNNVVKQLNARGGQLPPKSVLDEQVLDRLILQELQIQKADAAGVRVSESEIDAALSQVARQNNLTLEQMQMALENDGLNFAEFRNEMSREIKTEKIRNGLANQSVRVSEHEIDLFLADNELSQKEVRLSHILIALDANASEQEVDEAKNKVNNIYTSLEQGENFSKLATELSDGQKALEGGDLGWRKTNELPTLFSDQLKVMKVGEYTHPVRSANGFHIIKLEDSREDAAQMITQYNARHILIENSELVTPSQGMEMINDLYKQLQNGGDFSKIAEEKSDDVSSAPLGGDLGWFEINKFGQRFGDVVKSLEDNEMSAPFQTQAGWHIVQKLGQKETDISEELKREQARRAIHARKMDEEIQRWLREIRGEAFVETRI